MEANYKEPMLVHHHLFAPVLLPGTDHPPHHFPFAFKSPLVGLKWGCLISQLNWELEASSLHFPFLVPSPSFIMAGRTSRLLGAVLRQPRSPRPRAPGLASRMTSTAPARPAVVTRRSYSSAANIRPTHAYATGHFVHVVIQRPDCSEEDTLTVPNLWLRDICPCPLCQSPSSGQKSFATCDLDMALAPKSTELKQDGCLHVEWSDAHTSVYPIDYVTTHYDEGIDGYRRPTLPPRTLWDRAVFERGLEQRNVQYSDWMRGGPAFSDALQTLSAYGLVVVKNVPEAESSVQKVGERIGRLMDTFYGRTWDVVSKPDAENVAYTSEFLPLHQDLLYHNPVPKIQLLHCLKNECSGGDSLFSDGVLAYWRIQLQDPRTSPTMPEAVKIRALTSSPLRYCYTKNGNDRDGAHPVFEYDDPAALLVQHVNWSPPFQAPFFFKRYVTEGPKKTAAYPGRNPELRGLDIWLEAMRTFRDTIEAPQNMWQYKMEPGDCVLFDNRRILHGRTRFEPSEGGQRHLRGAYLDEPTYDRVRRQHVHGWRMDKKSKRKMANAEESQALSIIGAE